MKGMALAQFGLQAPVLLPAISQQILLPCWPAAQDNVGIMGYSVADCDVCHQRAIYDIDFENPLYIDDNHYYVPSRCLKPNTT